jgi:hypothetical protein
MMDSAGFAKQADHLGTLGNVPGSGDVEEGLGREHPETLTSMNNLASTYWKQGKSSEAEVLEVEVLEVRKKVLGPEHPNTSMSISNLASTYWKQGISNEAVLAGVVVELGKALAN